MGNGILPSLLNLDHDTVLILALIYLLYKQDADQELILALLFVLIA